MQCVYLTQLSRSECAAPPGMLAAQLPQVSEQSAGGAANLRGSSSFFFIRNLAGSTFVSITLQIVHVPDIIVCLSGCNSGRMQSMKALHWSGKWLIWSLHGKKMWKKNAQGSSLCTWRWDVEKELFEGCKTCTCSHLQNPLRRKQLSERLEIKGGCMKMSHQLQVANGRWCLN